MNKIHITLKSAKYKEIIERHLRSFIRHFLSTLLKVNVMYLAACFQRRCVV